MGNQLVSGGRRKTHFFSVKLKSDGTAYEFLNPTTGAVITTPTLANAKAYELTNILSSKPSNQPDGNVKMSFENVDGGEEFFDFLNLFAVPPAEASSSLPDLLFENADKQTSAESVSSTVLIVSYLHYDKLASPTKLLVLAALGTIAPTSGSFETKGNDYSKPSLEFEGVKTKVALSIPVAIFDTTLLTAPGAAQVIPASTGFLRKFLAKAA
jgi:hypothetical protein